jgi:hypothetical protein
LLLLTLLNKIGVLIQERQFRDNGSEKDLKTTIFEIPINSAGVFEGSLGSNA